MSTEDQTPATTGAGHANSAENLSAHQQNRIPAYKVREATEHLPVEQQIQIRWLHAYYWDGLRGLSETARGIGRDGGTLSKIFNGKFEGDLGEVAKEIVQFRKLLEERASVHRAPFIETKLYRDIEKCCEAALTYQKIVAIYGESQVGKTASLKRYTETHNHGQTIYVEMPPGGALSTFIAALAPKVRVGNNGRVADMILAITRALGPNNLLIIDEAVRAMQAKSVGGQSLKTLDFIRAIHDTSGCGVVLCGTNVFREGMESQAQRKFLNQLNRRCLFRKQLPDRPTPGDLNAFAKHYGLAPAEGEALRLQGMIVGEHGLGVWLTTLMAAARKATREKRKMDWGHVLKARALFESMERPDADEREAA